MSLDWIDKIKDIYCKVTYEKLINYLFFLDFLLLIHQNFFYHFTNRYLFIFVYK